MTSSMLAFTYDAPTGMAYVKVSDGDIVRTVATEYDLNVDLDADGRVVGVEIFA